jgi:hypothetical protein
MKNASATGAHPGFTAKQSSGSSIKEVAVSYSRMPQLNLEVHQIRNSDTAKVIATHPELKTKYTVP